MYVRIIPMATIEGDEMILQQTKNLKLFKKEIGQVNHFLITILVGLDSVWDGKANKKESFSTSWEPKNIKTSAERSAQYARKATLAWIVESIEMYLRLSNEEPRLLSDPIIQGKFDSFGRSVYKQAMEASEYYNVGNIQRGFMDLTICWRNNLVHYKADNQIIDVSKSILEESSEMIFQSYSGLDIFRMLESYKKKNVPTFKEVASMVKASIEFITELDSIMISKLDQIEYIDSIFINYIKSNKISRMNNIFSKDEQTKLQKLRNILREYGYDETVDETIDEFVYTISKYNYSTADSKFTSGSFT